MSLNKKKAMNIIDSKKTVLENIKLLCKHILSVILSTLENIKNTIQKKLIGFSILSIFTILYSVFYRKETTEMIDGIQVPVLGKNYEYDLRV